MKILIIGNGLIASAIVQKLELEGHEILIFSRNFNKEIKENKEIEIIVKNDTSTYKVNECCGAEECVCKRKTAIGFGEWLLFNNISYINNTSEGPVYKFLGFGLTIKELYELYSKKL